ncbi:hypothetical protein TWF694_011633 [Orbilia ellipsospora]|uniref:Uncharacterized protein n=1 Tax=Orbilia ellipsospora TaxID=2528407 RepID=A0AAV9X6Z8_9PEZI
MDIRPRTPPPPVRRKKPQTAVANGTGVVTITPGQTTNGQGSQSVQNGQSYPAKVELSSIAQNQPAAKIRRIECFVFERESGQKPTTENIVTNEQDIRTWLGTPIPKSFNGKTDPLAGLRLICARQQVSTTSPFDEETFKSINDALGIPSGYSYLNACKAGAYGKFMVNGCEPVFIYHRSNNNGTVSAILRWDSATNFTYGYLLLGPRISLRKVAADLVSQFPSFAHPLFVPTYLGECTANDLMLELHHIHSALAMAERRTRFGDWEVQDTASEMAVSDDGHEEDFCDEKNSMIKMSTTRLQPAMTSNIGTTAAHAGDSDSEDEDPTVAAETRKDSRYWTSMWQAITSSDQNYHLMSQILGTLSCRFAFMDVAIDCSIAGVQATRRELDRMPDNCRSRPHLKQLNAVANTECLGHRIDLLLSNLQHIKRFGAIAQRMQVQRDVLFNLIAQDENNLNLSMAADSKQLAEASKRDSSAMKVLAILTTVFLPATFVATLFAMPLFNWGAGTMSGVMSGRFWVYWAIVIPLSIVVMGTMGSYALIQSRKNRLAAEKARKRAGLKEA